MATDTQAFAFDDESALGQPLDDKERLTSWAVLGFLAVVLTAGYWNMFRYTGSFWDDPLYSHGYLIPLIAAVLLWMRSDVRMYGNEATFFSVAMLVLAYWPVRAIAKGISISQPILVGSLSIAAIIYLYFLRRATINRVPMKERWIGLAILVASLGARLYFSTYDINPFDRASYIVALLGVTMIVGGWSMLKWAGPPIAFLIFMFPIPSVLQNSVLLWLQKLAAISSTWTLQLLGVPALRDGSRLMIDGLELEVADACSGLRMSTIFGAMSVALAMMMNRPWWDRVVILLSAIPVALFTNVIRITITALLYLAFPESEAVKHAVHDWAGLAMMPIAMGILWLELALLHKITVPIDTEEEYAAFSTAHG